VETALDEDHHLNAFEAGRRGEGDGPMARARYQAPHLGDSYCYRFGSYTLDHIPSLRFAVEEVCTHTRARAHTHTHTHTRARTHTPGSM